MTTFVKLAARTNVYVYVKAETLFEMDKFVTKTKRKRELDDNNGEELKKNVSVVVNFLPIAGPDATKAKTMEICPHAERCYRKNPHHFREYDHPHLNTFLEKSEPLTLPDGFPQEKQVVMEQLAVLKSLKKVVTAKKIEEVPATSSNHRREKTTCFVPNSVQNKISGGNRGSLTMLEKLDIAAPYNIFFTRIPESPETIKQPNSIAFTGIFFSITYFALVMKHKVINRCITLKKSGHLDINITSKCHFDRYIT